LSTAVVDQTLPKPSNRVVRSRKSFSSGADSGARGYPIALMSDQTNTRRDGSRYGNGDNNIARTMLKIALFAPMPSASVTMAAAVNPGVFASERNVYRASQSVV